MSIYISTLTENDYEPSLNMIREAFKEMPESDHQEQALVRKLRLEPGYHYELEVIAKDEAGEIIGHALCSPIQIKSHEETFDALALAPVAVKKPYRQKGIGKALIHALEERAQELEYTTIVVLGHPDYYKALGYELALEAWDQNFLRSAGELCESEIFMGYIRKSASWRGHLFSTLF